jgi:glucosamine-6-phosphate deaminase
MQKTDQDVEYFRVEKLKVEVHSSREAAGAAAANASAQALKTLAASGKNFGVIFATGASQMEALKSLTAIPGLPWRRVDGFHMDDYIGLPLDHPASFRGYLEEKLVRKVPMHSFAHIDGLHPIRSRPAATMRKGSASLVLNSVCWASEKMGTWPSTTRARPTLTIRSTSR